MQATSSRSARIAKRTRLNILRLNAFAATGSESLSRLRFLPCAPTACGRFLHRSALPAQRVPLHLILVMLAAGKAVGQIAEELHLSGTIVSTHRARILEKMEMSTTAELIRYAVRNHLAD